MNPNDNYSEVIGGKRYSVATSELLASDAYWDGHNFERSGRNTFLYKTAKGNYFTLTMSCWQGETDAIEPVSKSDAMVIWEGLREKKCEYEEAFGQEAVEA